MCASAISPIQDQDAADERARDLEAAGLNGLAAALMSFDAPAAPAQARMELRFINDLHIADIRAEIAGGAMPASVFPLSGGHRIRGGIGAGEVRCVDVSAGPVPTSLILIFEPVGDYSTYTLDLTFDPARIDPFFSALQFKFRPGCFTNDCTPAALQNRARTPAPVIDYLAKDYDSFRHVLISAMMQRVPGWQVTSEADFDQVLIDLIAAAGDELSDFQDRVMNEAYMATARSRVSLARHARLMDYHIHQGQQASTYCALTIADGVAPFTLADDLVAWTGGPDAEGDVQAFATHQSRLEAPERVVFAPGFNRFELYTWAGAHPALRAGSTTADIVPLPGVAGGVTAAELAGAINDGTLRRILIAQQLNPLTGRRAGFDRRARQMLDLLPGARMLHDPLTGTDLVRITWAARDALQRDYAFSIQCPDGAVDKISGFTGNLVQMHHGLPVTAHFYEPGTILPVEGPTEFHRYYHRQTRHGEARAVTAALPVEAMPLAYVPTARGGVVAPRSSLRVTVQDPGGGLDPWDEVISLVHSDDSAENGDHFSVETDEHGESKLRFGNGINGRLIAGNAVIRATYQVGGGEAGNVGADAITGFAPLAGALAAAITSVTNPFDVTNGTGPEPVDEILRNVPEAFRTRQLRAVTLADYVARAQEVPGVQRAVASYAWTGSWRTVRLVIDPVGTTQLSPDLVQRISAHMRPVRLIGEDIEIRAPRFVPLSVRVALCLHPHVWPEDIRAELQQAFSDSWTATGEAGFFNPDRWVFGQSLHRSQIAGRVAQVAGVDHVLSIAMQRYGIAAAAAATLPEVLEMGFDEILLVRNDPDQMERGTISFDIQGGRGNG